MFLSNGHNNRTLTHLALALADARANNYALGVKLVRGAYHPHEIAAHRAAVAYDKAAASGDSAITTVRPSLSISPDIEPPVWMDKRETDMVYELCLKLLIKKVKADVERREETAGHTIVERNIEVTAKKGWFDLFSSGASIFTGGADTKQNERPSEVDKTTTLTPPRIGVLFGTHNWDSCGLVLKNLVDAGLAITSDGQEFKPEAPSVVKISDEVVKRIVIAQHYGTFVLHKMCANDAVYSLIFFLSRHG